MTDLDEMLTNCQPGEALLYTPPNTFEIVPNRKPRLQWERVEVGADEYQWRAKTSTFDLFVDESDGEGPFAWSVESVECDAASDAPDVETAKLAAEDYVLAELAKDAAAFGKVLVDTGAAR